MVGGAGVETAAVWIDWLRRSGEMLGSATPGEMAIRGSRACMTGATDWAAATEVSATVAANANGQRIAFFSDFRCEFILWVAEIFSEKR